MDASGWAAISRRAPDYKHRVVTRVTNAGSRVRPPTVPEMGTPTSEEVGSGSCKGGSRDQADRLVGRRAGAGGDAGVAHSYSPTCSCRTPRMHEARCSQ